MVKNKILNIEFIFKTHLKILKAGYKQSRYVGFCFTKIR